MIPSAPDIVDEAGRAWRIDLSALRGKHPSVAAYWLIEAPGISPFSHSYGVLLCEARGLHEITLWALDPRYARLDAMATIEPAIYRARFLEISPGDGDARVALAVRAICAGLISPESGRLVQWTALFGENRIDGKGSDEGMVG